MTNCYVQFWKEAVRKENGTRDSWTTSYGSGGSGASYHAFSKPAAEQQQYIERPVNYRLGSSHPTAYANNPYVPHDGHVANHQTSNPYQPPRTAHNGDLKTGVPNKRTRNWLPQPVYNYNQTGWVPQLQMTQGDRYDIPVAGVATALPRVATTNAWAAHSLPPAGSAGHSPKNGHYVNGHLYGTGSRNQMMAHHNSRMKYQPMESRNFRYTH